MELNLELQLNPPFSIFTVDGEIDKVIHVSQR